MMTMAAASATAQTSTGLNLTPNNKMPGTIPGGNAREGEARFEMLLSTRNGVESTSGTARFALIKSVCRHGAGSGRFFCVAAKILKGKKSLETEYPWPDKIKIDEHGGSLKFLSRFKPLPAPPKTVTLPFERPLLDLAKKIDEVRELARKTGMDFCERILELEGKYYQVRKDLYLQLTPVQRLSVARHPNRPTCLDHVVNIADKWLELHGDRGGFEDPALVTGIGKIDSMSFMFLGHQKGRNTKENIYRNFAMPTPNGYRKALRMMRHAEHHGFPILTFIDTPGAYAGLKAEELGQGEAIAVNLREMFGLRVPIITTVIGEGGSGGALAIGCCDKMLMLENAVYYVASPEACAAILWKTADAAPQATEALRITATELQKLGIVDEVIPEPDGGAHSDPQTTSKNIKEAVTRHLRELLKLAPESLLQQRLSKFRNIGSFEEAKDLDPYIKRNMKPREVPLQNKEIKELPNGVKKQFMDGKLTIEAPMLVPLSSRNSGE